MRDVGAPPMFKPSSGGVRLPWRNFFTRRD
jgi:hypothetical protein